MRTLLGNNCAKGCLLYLVALVALLLVAGMGLSGLRARFGGADVQGLNPQYAIQRTDNAPQPAPPPPDSQGNTAGAGSGGGGAPTPTPAPAQPQPAPSVAPPQPAPTAAPPPPSQAQGGTITGETGAPFYIVQPGDTLWAIAQRFGVDLDALRALNNLSDDIIYPNQVLYLPVNGTAQPTPPAAPQTGAGGDSDAGTGGVPSMPHTGITKKP